MDVLSVKLNKVGFSDTSYIITIPMLEGRSDFIFLDDNADIDKAKSLLQKDNTYIKDHGIVTEVEELSCIIKRNDGTHRKLFFATPQNIKKFKNHVCLHACKDIAHYMCVSRYTLGFQKMRVVWNEKGYPYLELDKKNIVLLIPHRPVSPDGICIGPAGFEQGYTIDAFAPHVIEKRVSRERENDTGMPVPLI